MSCSCRERRSHERTNLAAADGRTGRGLAKMMTARVGAGVYGQAVVRVDVAGGGPELCRSATVAAKETARILYRERYLDREIVVNFAAAESAAEGFGNVLGRSAELAFALALTAAVLDRDFPRSRPPGLSRRAAPSGRLTASAINWRLRLRYCRKVAYSPFHPPTRTPCQRTCGKRPPNAELNLRQRIGWMNSWRTSA